VWARTRATGGGRFPSGARRHAALWTLASVTAWAPSAPAQTTARGWALDRYEPPVAGDAFLLAEHPWYRGTRLVAAAFTLDYAANPLWLRIPRDGLPALDQAVVSAMLTAHLGVAVSPLPWLGAHLSLPVALQQSGVAIPAGAGNLGPSAGVAPGDLRAGLRLRLVGDAGRDPFSLHLGALLWLPTGSPADNTGDGAARAEARVVAAGTASRLRWSAGAGFHVRGAIDALNLAVGHELRATAALSISLLRGRFDVGVETAAFTALRDRPDRRGSAAFTRGQWGAEAMLSARWRVADPVQLGLAGGLGLGEGYGIPEARALLAVVYAPEEQAPPTRPSPFEPVPVEPSPVEPSPVEPSPVEPAPVEPAPVAVAPVSPAGGAIRWAAAVDFRTHRERIVGDESFEALNAVADALRAAPGVVVDVQVHSGHRSNPEFYLALSTRRAEAVRQYLVGRGVEAGRLLAHGMGAACMGRHRDHGDVPRVRFVVVAPGTAGGQCVRVEAEEEPAPRRSRHRR